MKSLDVDEILLKQIIFSKQSLVTDVITQQYSTETCKCKSNSCKRKFSIQQCKNSSVKYRFFVGDNYILSLNNQNKIQEGFVVQFTYEHGNKCVKKINMPLQFNIDQIVLDILQQSFHFLDFESPKQQLQALIKYHDIYDLKHDSIKSFGLAGTEFFIFVMRESFPFIYIEDSEITNILIRNKVKVLPTAIYEFGDEEFTMKNILLEYLSMQYDQNAVVKIKEFKQQIQNQQNNIKNINNDKKAASFDQMSLNLYDLSQFQLNQCLIKTNQSLRSVLSELKKKQQTINIKMVKVDTSTYYIQSDTFINSSPFNSILNVLIKTLNQFKCARFNVSLTDELEKDFGRLLNVLKHNNIQDLTQKILELSQFDAVFFYSNVTTGAYELLCKYLTEDFVNESIIVFDPQQPPQKFLKQQEQNNQEQNDSHINKSNAIQNDLKMIQQNSFQQQQQQQLKNENIQQNKKYSILNEEQENKEDVLLKELPKCQVVSLKSSSKSNNQQQLEPVNSVIASLHETSIHNRQIAQNNFEQQSNELLFVNNNSTQKSNNSINQMFPQQIQTVNQQLGYQILPQQLPAQQLPYVAQQYPSPNYLPNNNYVGLGNMQYQQPIPPQNMYYPQNMYPQPQFVPQMQYMNPNYYQQLSNINQPNYMQPQNYMFQQPQMSQPQLTPIYPPGYEPSQSQQFNPSNIMQFPVQYPPGPVTK
ncbi:Hypothetical_protein [Hexamita inflata]|uniref:Hypothetical_protein n=1 Tax=Hexamita inflata TaxID=28002 RepID=A0AA86RP12_9EUKA|nr:Hypothetical protein HINF_LOCUS64673 [Hexamita inflata]